MTEFGSFALEAALSAAAPTGAYRILVNRGEEHYSGQFLVEQYQLEKVKLDLTTARDVYFRGETIDGVIRAQYYYGEPLRAKTVSYTLADGAPQTAVTNERGEIAFSLPTRDFVESQTLTLTARLDDEQVQAAKTVWLATRGFSCEVSTIRNVYLAGEDLEVQVKTVDPAGKPVAEALTVTVFQQMPDAGGEVQRAAYPVTTDADGTGRVMLQLADGGDYLVRATGRDRFGHPVSGETPVFISGPDDDIKLRFLTDAETLRVGDTPTVTLHSRAAAGLGLLTYEAETILAYQVFTIQPAATPLQLTIGSDLAPNFTLAAALMDGHKFHTAQKEFTVLQELHIALHVTPVGATAAPETFRPGDTVELHIVTTDQNDQPVAAEVSVALVDEALYARYADAMPPITAYFYDQRRDLRAQTGTSCTFQFYARTQAIVNELIQEEGRLKKEALEMQSLQLFSADELAAPEPAPLVKDGFDADKPSTLGLVAQALSNVFASAPAPAEKSDRAEAAAFLTSLRAYFPETGYWHPQIVTDANGQATVQITLPDSTTQWRLTSRGINAATLVGEQTANVITKLPFFAMLTEGDRADILVTLHNASGSTQDAEVTFTGSAGEVALTQHAQTVSAADQTVVETAYPLDLAQLTGGVTTLPLTLDVQAVTPDFQDQLKRDVFVRPYGLEYVSTRSGTLQSDQSIVIALPGDRQYVAQTMQILLNPALDRALVELTQDTPWEFRAPTSSGIHEAQVIWNALTQLKDSPAADPTRRALQQRFKALLNDLSVRQNSDGGWNWTGLSPRSDVLVSADALQILAEAQRAGYAVTPAVLAKARNYLKQGFQAAQDNEIKTYLLYALSFAEEVDFAYLNRIYRERHTLHSSGLALLTLLYQRAQRPEIAVEIAALLQDRAKVHTDQATGQKTVFWPSDSPVSWLQGDVDVTAWGVYALQKAQPVSPLIPGALTWLNAQRQWRGWGSMRTNARVSFALLEQFTHTRFTPDRYVLQVSVNDQPVKRFAVQGAQGALTLSVPPELLRAGNNTVTFAFSGRGALAYVCVLQGLSRDVQRTQQDYQVWRSYEAAPLTYKGQEIPRGFGVLQSSYSTWTNPISQIPLGGFGRVTLQYQQQHYDDNLPAANPQVILEEPLPGGGMVLAQSVQGNFLDYEIQDGKILFYLENARYGRITYDLYGYLPGAYRVLPTKIASAYARDQQDYGEPYQLTILARGAAVTETYKKTPDELYYYGKALFDDKQYRDAQPLLENLFAAYQLQPEPYRETARMLLYIALAEDKADAIVRYFEVLKEKYPDLVLTFEEMLHVGRAYIALQEDERAAQVFKATAEASFMKDAQVSGTLEAQGEFLAAADYTRNLLRVYPDLPVTETSFYALAQLLYTEALRSKAGETDVSRANGKDWRALLQDAIIGFQQFLARYPEQPLGDEVSFALANAYLDLEAFETVVTLAPRLRERYPRSPFLSGYDYIAGYANFELARYDASLALCGKVATEKYPNAQGQLADSEHKHLARYIMGQIYHAQGQPAQAIAEYAQVTEMFPDAREAIAYFIRKRLQFEEATTFYPGAETALTLTYRNVTAVNLLAYRVDLMKLYLLQKNLNNITNINLAGITPYYQQAVTLTDAQPYTEHEARLPLPLAQEGAYLVVAKEAERDTSGMALLTQLRLQVEEDSVSGRVRVNVLNAKTGQAENKVHVKVIGSTDADFVSGATDLRGIFIADNIHGAATVIARKGDQYAFYRGITPLQPSLAPVPPQADMRQQATQMLRETNLLLQQKSAGFLRQNVYTNTQRGVEVQAAY